ncbi:hypothetical protein JIX56_07895 [Streptomyces sp. CA-210063]|uniref:hypothetical protein n=1 Tax=Streptomyces sp. CA-210063 TaxID=2801029 RepID=UPI00214B2E1B|nr:hypothetical protein [Streptomyces sp. CA-210063]UUU29811.1 hypothetical protein JIX56_07895 [Streptomyces sp. CA-210063]
MSSSGDARREPTSPLERETDERDVHPEEEGRPQPDTSAEPTEEALRERAESEEGPG